MFERQRIRDHHSRSAVVDNLFIFCTSFFSHPILCFHIFISPRFCPRIIPSMGVSNHRHRTPSPITNHQSPIIIIIIIINHNHQSPSPHTVTATVTAQSPPMKVSKSGSVAASRLSPQRLRHHPGGLGGPGPPRDSFVLLSPLHFMIAK